MPIIFLSARSTGGENYFNSVSSPHTPQNFVVFFFNEFHGIHSSLIAILFRFVTEVSL